MPKSESNCFELFTFTQLVNGPSYIIKLTADVARPKIELSSSMIDFGTVLCGQCKVVTIRLHNPYFVK